MSTSAPAAIQPIRVLLCDDHPAICSAAQRATYKDRSVFVECAGAATGALSLVKSDRFDVVQMDVSGVGRVWPAVGEITDLGVPVLVVTGDSNPMLADRAIEHGASGIASKGTGESELVAALRVVAEGGEHWDHPWDKRLAELRGSKSPALLGEADLALINALSLNKTQAETALVLDWSRRKLKRRIESLSKRFGVRDDEGLLISLIRRGYVDAHDLAGPIGGEI